MTKLSNLLQGTHMPPLCTWPKALHIIRQRTTVPVYFFSWTCVLRRVPLWGPKHIFNPQWGRFYDMNTLWGFQFSRQVYPYSFCVIASSLQTRYELRLRWEGCAYHTSVGLRVGVTTCRGYVHFLLCQTQQIFEQKTNKHGKTTRKCFITAYSAKLFLKNLRWWYYH